MSNLSSQLGLSEEQLLTFARRALSSPAAAFGAMTLALQDTARSMSDLGMTPEALERLALAERDSEDRDQLEAFVKGAMFNGDEKLNIAMAQALETRSLATEKRNGYRSYDANVSLDFMDLNYLLERSDQIVSVWMSCRACVMLNDAAVETAIARPQCFETPGGVERLAGALKETNRLEGGETFWTRSGPLAFEGALARALQDGEWEILSEACYLLSLSQDQEERSADSPIANGDSGASELSAARLTRVCETLGDLYRLRPHLEEGLGLLSDLASRSQWAGLEVFAKTGDWSSHPARLSKLEFGIPLPYDGYIAALEPHPSVEQSELHERPLRISDLGALWGMPELFQIGSRLGESGADSAAFAQALGRYGEAGRLSKTDAAAAEALAQSAELLWASRPKSSAGALPSRASLAI